jgi:subtilisin family serine protease
MAAPFVSGQAALIHSVDPYLPVTTIENLIGDTARPLYEQDPTYSDGMGDGHADIGASLEQLSPGAGCGGA